MSELTATIIDIGDESMLGLCEDGRKIWLDGPAVPGDRVTFEMTGKTGTVLEITEEAPERRPAFCPAFDACPGCQLQPLPYAQQLERKASKIVEALRRLGGVQDVPFEGIVPSPREEGSRNKLDFTVEGNRMGYQTRKGLLPLDDCPAGHPQLRKVIPGLQKWLEKNPRNQLHRLLLRVDGSRQKVHVLLRGILEEDERAEWICWADNSPGVESLSIQKDWRAPWHSLFGEGRLRFSLADQQHEIAYDSFFQVNDELADHLVRDTLNELEPGGGNLLDLFCGAGAFTLPASSLGFNVLGLDSRPGKGPFLRADLRKGLPKRVLNQTWQTVITDPPRSGMEKHLCTQIRDRITPEHILYVSCNPATLARDLQRLCAKGDYSLVKVKGYDLFPQTTHVETLALLKRVQ